MQGTNPIYAGGMGTTHAVSVGKAYIKILQAVRAQQTLCSARHMPDSRACMRYGRNRCKPITHVLEMVWAHQMQGTGNDSQTLQAVWHNRCKAHAQTRQAIWALQMQGIHPNPAGGVGPADARQSPTCCMMYGLAMPTPQPSQPV